MSQGKDRIKQIRKSLGMSQYEFSESIGIPCTTVNSIEGGKQKLSVRGALAMKDNIVRQPDGKLRIVTKDTPPQYDEASLCMDWLVAGLGEPFDKTVGSNAGWFNCDNNISLPTGENIEFYTMNDDSMYPLFLPNEHIAVDKNLNRVQSGHVYLINYAGIKMLRKIYIVNKEKYNLVAINEKIILPQEVQTDEIEIIGEYIYKIAIANEMTNY